MFVMTATVISIDSRGLLVRDASNGQEVFVNFNNPGAFSPGDMIRISFNGIMTQSIPPQISASSIVRINPLPQPQPSPQPSFNEIRRALIVQVRRNMLVVRDPSNNNRITNVNYSYAYHFCVGQRVNIAFDTVLLGESNQLTINATEVVPVC